MIGDRRRTRIKICNECKTPQGLRNYKDYRRTVCLAMSQTPALNLSGSTISHSRCFSFSNGSPMISIILCLCWKVCRIAATIHQRVIYIFALRLFSIFISFDSFTFFNSNAIWKMIEINTYQIASRVQQSIEIWKIVKISRPARKFCVSTFREINRSTIGKLIFSRYFELEFIRIGDEKFIWNAVRPRA